MSALDRPMRSLAGTLTGIFGRGAIYRIPAPADYSPATLESQPDGDPVAIPVKVTPGESAYAQTGRDPQSLTERGRRAVLVAATALPVTPSTSHRMTLDGRSWSIEEHIEVFSGAQAAAFILILAPS